MIWDFCLISGELSGLCPKNRQNLVFSATMPKMISNLVQDILNHPITIQVNQTGPAPRIAHGRFNVQKEKRTDLLKTLFAKNGMASTIVFTRTKHKAKSLADQLKKSGFNYDLPDTVETYIHRTGRTGRANQAGQAYTFTTMEDNKTITLIKKALGRKMTEE